MKKFKYVKISKNKKIRIIYNFNKSNLFIVFLHGLKSDLTGKKPNCFLDFCKKRKIQVIFSLSDPGLVKMYKSDFQNFLEKPFLIFYLSFIIWKYL